MPISPARRFWRWFGIAFAGVLLITIAWAGSNPLGMAPDEGVHARTAYAVVRLDIGDVNPVVPAIYDDLGGRGYKTDGDQLMCPQKSWSISAACQDWALYAGKPPVRSFTQFATYNPVYYVIVGWPTLLLEPRAALYAMRGVSAVLFSGLVAAAIAIAATAFRRRWVVGGVLLALPPMVLFLGGVLNPNSIEIATAVLVWTGLAALFGRELRPPLSPLVITTTTIGMALLALNRLLSPLWLLIILLTTLFATRGWRRLWQLARHSRYFQVHLGVAAVAVVLALVWTRTHPTVFVGGVHPAASLSDAVQLGMQQLFQGFAKSTLTGTFAVLGWWDLPIYLAAPVFVALWGALVGGALFVGRTRSARLAPVLLVAFWVVFPTALAAYMWSNIGVQPRYWLPIAVGIPIVASLVLAERAETSPAGGKALTAALRFGAVAVMLTDLYAFVINYHRYAAGFGGPWDPSAFQWNAPLGPIPWLAALLVGSAVLAFAFWRGTRDERAPSRRIEIDVPAPSGGA